MIDKKNISSPDETIENAPTLRVESQAVVNTSELHPLEDSHLHTNEDLFFGKKAASLRLVIPTYLDNQLTQIAASKRVTKRYLILQALAEAGYHIEKEDLVTDKRKLR